MWLLPAILILAGSALAQETPKVEISGSYSFLRFGANQNGASFSVAGNVNSWFGVVGDFGFYHSSFQGIPAIGLGTSIGLNTDSFLFGPRFSMRSNRKVTPFGQVLVGGAHLSAGTNGISAAITPFAVSTGGGVDFAVAPHIALRPQFDYILMRYNGSTQTGFRVSFGVVFGLGSR